ncbi:MAG: DUF429 domain-containing protein, partial [Caulobacteraceae bacterium]
SKHSRKRWAATARRVGSSWEVSAPERVGLVQEFLHQAFASAGHDRVLLGFDFPIGLPEAYGVQTGARGFVDFLDLLRTNAWPEFFEVAQRPDQISLRRPFYPQGAPKGVTRAALVAGLGVSSFNELLRASERATSYRQAACSIFWTLGGNQVGKAALAGWQEVVIPARRRGARLWPFEGTLAELAVLPGVVIAETYPAEAYRLVGAEFSRGESKRRMADRCRKAEAIFAWAAAHGVRLAPGAQQAILDGFGPLSAGEDAFDALMGLVKMIEVADGRRPEATEVQDRSRAWEGWILAR